MWIKLKLSWVLSDNSFLTLKFHMSAFKKRSLAWSRSSNNRAPCPDSQPKTKILQAIEAVISFPLVGPKKYLVNLRIVTEVPFTATDLQPHWHGSPFSRRAQHRIYSIQSSSWMETKWSITNLLFLESKTVLIQRARCFSQNKLLQPVNHDFSNIFIIQ